MTLYPWNKFFEISPFRGETSDVGISEDENNVYVEVPMPGVENPEVTFEQGVLRVKGTREEKHEDRRHYRRAVDTFSYQVVVPGDLDPDVHPEAVCEKGVLRITFRKKPEEQPKQIEVRHKD